MKTIFTLITAIALVLGTGVTAFGQGCTSGPYPGESATGDGYGYTWKSDSVANGPTAAFTDISGSGTQVVGLTDDNFAGPFPIGFDFPYYSNTFNQLYIGANGYVIFGNPVNVASNATGFPVFPTPGGPATANNYIGMFLSDLTLTDGDGNAVPGAGVYYEQTDDSTFVISFQDVPFWTDEEPGDYRGANNFQLTLRESGNFEFQYGDISQGDVHSSYAQPGVNFMTRGFEDVVGQVGTCLPSTTYPDDNSAISVVRPSTTNYELEDLSIEWVYSEGNLGSFLLVGETLNNIQVKISNTGTETVPPAQMQVAYLDVLDENTPTSLGVITVPSLAAGETQIVDVDVSIPTDEPKIYTLQARFIQFSDDFTLNNTQLAELNVVPLSADNKLVLGYDRFTFSDHYGVDTWNESGQTGVGVQPYSSTATGGEDQISAGLKVGQFIEGPIGTDEFTVEQIHIGLALDNLEFDGDNNGQPDFPNAKYEGFEVEVFENNGGSPGSLLYSVVITGAELKTEFPSLSLQDDFGNMKFYTIDIPEADQPSASNGVFVSYNTTEEPDSLIFGGMMVDASGASPTSYRTFEITGGVWSPYRDRTSDDFAIRIGVGSLNVGLEDNFSVSDIALGQNRPNPTADRTVIPFTLKKLSEPTLIVRNLLGQEVHRANLGNKLPGDHTYGLSTEDMAPGVYTYTLQVAGYSQSKKMIVTK